MITLERAPALFIHGAWTAAGGGTEAVINPATEQVIGHAAIAGPADVEAAVASARHAFDKGPWPRMNAEERASILSAMLEIFERRGDEIRALITAEAGSVQPMTRTMQFATGIDHARYYIELARRPAITPLPVELVDTPDGRRMLGAGVKVREPVGVCLAITPFNVPFMLNVTKCFAALATGNAVILKPSPLTPFEAFVVAEAAEEAGLPPGILNVVNGGIETGEALTRDPRIDLVTFTGSDRVGAAIQAQAAPTLKRCVLELGGKSALIVRADGDLKAAATSALASLTLHAGQACAAFTRLLVHESVRAEFVSMLTAMFRAVPIGDPADPKSRMGPLIRGAQRDRVESMVDRAVRDGVKLVTGGRRPTGLSRGFYYEPTLFDGVDNQSPIAREEIFGPVGVVIGFESDEQAIDIANDSDFGLSGGIYSADVGRAFEMALQLRTGKVQLNGGSGKMSSHQPFGGIKRSGYGRELGEEGLQEFTYVKSIAFHGG
ncbi:MAG: aldehyde dehydrogenase [Alphaproteobacteria bacterium]|nr:aldehyde dehydrogenase [Alphaproteobacteria bacterium]